MSKEPAVTFGQLLPFNTFHDVSNTKIFLKNAPHSLEP